MKLQALLALFGLVTSAKRSLRGGAEGDGERPEIWTGDDWLTQAGDDDWMYPYSGHYINDKHWYTHFNPWSANAKTPNDAQWLAGKVPVKYTDNTGSYMDAAEVLLPSAKVVEDDDASAIAPESGAAELAEWNALDAEIETSNNEDTTSTESTSTASAAVDTTVCGSSCYDVAVTWGQPCNMLWSQGCGDAPPPAGFTADSTLAELCPQDVDPACLISGSGSNSDRTGAGEEPAAANADFGSYTSYDAGSFWGDSFGSFESDQDPEQSSSFVLFRP